MLEAEAEILSESPESAPAPEAPEIDSITELTQVNPRGHEPAKAAPTPAEAQLMELEKVGKFKFEGKEWTAQELRTAYLMEKDYRQKTAAHAEQKKFYDNYIYDCDKIKQNPELVAEFKKIYPKQFHKYADYALTQVQHAQSQQQVPTQPSQTSQSSMDPDFLRRFNQLESHYQAQTEAAINAELDSKFGQLAKLYPFADEDAIVAKAEILASEPGRDHFSDLEWDQMWKSSHERNKTRWETNQKQLIESQKAVNKASKDVPSGGGIPAPPVKQPRTIKEASELARRAFEEL